MRLSTVQSPFLKENRAELPFPLQQNKVCHGKARSIVTKQQNTLCFIQLPIRPRCFKPAHLYFHQAPLLLDVGG